MIRAEKYHQFSGHTGAVYAVCGSDRVDVFFTAGSDGIIARWNWKTGKSEGAVARVQAPVFSLFYDIETGYLFAGREDGSVHVLDVKANREVKWMQNHAKGVFDIRANAAYIFFSGGDGKVSVVDRFSLETLRILHVADQKIRSVFIEPENKNLLAASADGMIRQFSMADFNRKNEWYAHEGAANAMAFLPGGRLISGGRDARLKIWDNGEVFLDIPAHNYAVYQIGLFPESDLMITCSRDKTLKLWNPESFEVLLRISRQTTDGHKNSVNRFLFLEEETKLISVSDDSMVMVWDISGL